jgi:ABC-2 type transport system permease protein
MNIFFTLMKTSLNLNFGISALKYKFTREKKRLWEPVLIGISIFIGIGSIISLFSLLAFSLFMAGKSLNRPELVLVLAFLASQVLVLFFGLFYIMSAFYFSRDFEILVPLPLKPSYVLGSKFLVVMVNEYLTLIPFLVPAIAIYGAGTGQGIFYWLKGLILILFSPVIPLIAAGIFILILMRFVNLRKSKDILAVIGGVAALLISLGANYFAQRLVHINQQDLLKNIGQSIINTIGNKFPPSLWATYGLVKPGFMGLAYFLLFISVSTGLFAVMLWLANRIFYKGLLSGQEVSRKRRLLSGSVSKFNYSRVLSRVSAIFGKEWRLFLRTPVFLINGVAGMVAAPFILAMPFIANDRNSIDIFNFIQNNKYSIEIALAGLAVIFFTSSINIVSSTSLSREGRTFWISKIIPVSSREQIKAKILHGMSIQGIGILFTGIILEIVVKYSIFRFIAIIFLAVLGDLLLVILNLIIDVFHPKLYWNNPQEAVKQNINGIFGMITTILVAALLGGFSVILILAHTPEWLVYAALAVLISIILIPSVSGLFKLAAYKYRQLEI